MTVSRRNKFADLEEQLTLSCDLCDRQDGKKGFHDSDDEDDDEDDFEGLFGDGVGSFVKASQERLASQSQVSVVSLT